MLLLIGLGLFVHRENFTYGLVGNDTYSQIVTSRVESASDFWDNFREPLAKDLIRASFYRPVQSFCIALDYALWGLAPAGYQVATMGVFAACIALLYLTAGRLAGRGAWLAPLVATLFLTLHPALLNVLPAPCRRAELLVSVFMLGTLLILPIGPGRRSWPRFLLAGLLVLLACASKEIGIIGIGLVFLHQLCFSFEGCFRRNLVRALLAALPAAGAAALYMAGRTIVLDGFGGYHIEAPAPFGYLLKLGSAHLAADALCPWSFLATWSPLQLASVSLTVLAILTAAFLAAGLSSVNPDAQCSARLLLLGVAWIVPLVIVLGLNQRYGPWYALVPLIGVALIIASLVRGIQVMMRGRLIARVLGGVSAAGVLAALIIALYASPLGVDYPHWRIATRLMRESLRRMEAKLRDAGYGERVGLQLRLRVTSAQPHDRPYARSPGEPTLHSVFIFNPRNVRSWVKLRYPDRNIHLLWGPRVPPPQAAADEVLLHIYPNRAPLR